MLYGQLKIAAEPPGIIAPNLNTAGTGLNNAMGNLRSGMQTHVNNIMSQPMAPMPAQAPRPPAPVAAPQMNSTQYSDQDLISKIRADKQQGISTSRTMPAAPPLPVQPQLDSQQRFAMSINHLQ